MNKVTLLKFFVQRRLQALGWEVRRFSLDELSQLSRFLKQHNVETVLDVGANVGQYASTLRAAGFDGKIVSFEPQTSAHKSLQARAAKDRKWVVAPRCAVGSAAGEITVNISDNSVSSSVLPILSAHTGSAPASKYVGSEVAAVIRLDDCDLVNRVERTFLKVDTQGFEQHVLDGAPELLQSLIGVQLEMSTARLYEGQASFVALIEQMQEAGFSVWGITPGFADLKSGRLLQADMTFFRE
jgi:FkbM family methyltransferase